MKHNNLTLLLVLILSSLYCLQVQAQEKVENAKVVIVEEVVDEQGKITKETRVLEGEEALKYIEDNPEVKEAYKEVEMEVKKEVKMEKGAKGAAVKQYKFKVKDKDGNIKELEWDGTGKMPEELDGLLDLEKRVDDAGEVTHTIKVDDSGKKTQMKIIKKGPGIEDVMDLDWEGDELPAEVREILEQEGIELEELKDAEGKKQIRVIKTMKQEAKPKTQTKKAQLGINVGKDPKGAKVIGINPDSAADVAGLKKGDVITQLDEYPVTDFMTLVDAISAHQPSEVVILTILRSGETITKEVTLKESVDPFPFKTWEEVMNYKKK